MKLDQTETSSPEYFLTFYYRRKYFRHNCNFHEIQENSRRFTDSMIQETTISQGNSRRVETITSQDLENVSMCHIYRQTGQIHRWKFPDCNVKSLMQSQIPWQFPDYLLKWANFPNSLIIPWFYWFHWSLWTLLL